MAYKENLKVKGLHLLLVIIGLAMAAISGYLTHHYYQLIFPTSLSVGALCDISSFWNCDGAALSPLGNVLNVPTSLLGLSFGVIVAIGGILRKDFITKTNFFLALLNLGGCIFLFGYSLLFLHGLCPGCTIYYVLSLLAVVIFFFIEPFPPRPRFSVLILSCIFVLTLMASAYAYNYERFKEQDEAILDWVQTVRQEAAIDEASLGFDLPLAKATLSFDDAPLRVTVFSDFQCPWCKIVGGELEKMAQRYRGQINIRYVFFPLDKSCNPQMKGNMHPLACSAARLSYCAKARFKEIHDAIYEHQDLLNEAWLAKTAQEFNVEQCFASEESKDAVKSIVAQAITFELDGVPTLFINGKKLSGLVPTRAMIALLDTFLDDAKKR